jgi:hypothetical protein
LREEDEEQQPANERRHYHHLGKLRRSAALEHCTLSALKLNAVAPMQ